LAQAICNHFQLPASNHRHTLAMAQKGGLTLAAGSAALMMLGAPAFTTAPLSSAAVPERSLASTSRDVQGAGFGGASVTVGAASVLALGAVAGGRRSAKAARSALLTKDDAGRYRFDTPEAPLVITEQPGITAPLGFWDPLGLSKSGVMTFKNDPTGFKHLREAEIKHGRVAMMGSVGNFVAHFWKLPGFENVPSGVKALDTTLGAEGFCVLFLFAGWLEVQAGWKPKGYTPGSFGDPANFGDYSLEMRNREINNCRMAMVAMLGQLVAEYTTGLNAAEQFGY